MLDNWGQKALAKIWRKELIEELQHADKLIEPIVFYDRSPPSYRKTAKEVLDSDLQAEMSARSLYVEAASYCHSVEDYVTRDLFEQLMHDEEEHIDFLETRSSSSRRSALSYSSQHHIARRGLKC